MFEITNEEFMVEDSQLEEMERQDSLHVLIQRLLYKLPPIDRRILTKKFGIGLPFPMTINEISENESISVNKIKYIITNAMKIIQKNISVADKNIIKELLG